MNYTIFHWINNFAGSSALLDKVMIFITNSAPYVTMILMFSLWFSNSQKEEAIRKQYTVLYTALSVCIALLLNVLIHALYNHPRPFVTYHVHKLVPHAADSSFVSDHAVLVFSIAFTMILRGEAWKNIALLWAILVGISRIYVGVHYPADIIGGAVLSFVTSALVVKYTNKVEPLARIVFQIYAKITKRIPLLFKYNHTT
ncbi:Undecaprenyl-diphosphatase [Bacillus sp. 491mf]|uniref:undecaprenyl-diphosphatase n=1 Tax=Bacillus TaxID=1386 RepID=UPI0008E3E745|nr:undecaprenyl-diphosphatase [Bacillus sp. 491mf]SFC56233.1 Undecaprenyl-diphosphatase [Bacillus sp. 491mf]